MRKMIIIGSSNNYNELGIVRSFGVNGVKPYGIIVCSQKNWKKDWLHQSKYWKKCYRVDSGEEAIKLLIEKFGEETSKPCVVSAADYLVQIIDKNYDFLSSKFILPSINKKQGEIIRFSNKLEQLNLTKRLGFKVLPTTIIYISEYAEDDIPFFGFPVLLKPAACGEGSKDDITICNNSEELNRAIYKFKEKKYKRVLCQLYLKNRTEIIAYGAVSKKYNLCSYTVLKNIRQWPESYGVGSYGKLITNPNICQFIDKFYKSIMDFGYDGPIDTDIFMDNNTGDFFISEYNWRTGGRNYTSLGTDVYSVVYWFFLYDGMDVSKFKMINDRVGYTMNDATDFNHVIFGNISLKDWSRSFRCSIVHAVTDWKDIRPMYFIAISLIKKWIKKRFFYKK